MGSVEPLTISGMEIYAAHLRRLLGVKFQIQSLELVDLQSYVSARAKDPGIRGRRVSPATIKKDIVTLRTVWNWAVQSALLCKPFPGRGLRFPKLEEKAPFQTIAEIERRVQRGGLTKAQNADLCLVASSFQGSNQNHHRTPFH
ncbi:hypothetical protein [Lacipirellula parvula]|uniref:Core-binding (CB) domain-containing protein n=1 Tax=Lacipirellula parvula TaxID=2650471 RepID=A0A5K7XBT5_9BACT|nr:hypothetical protein [Lacipirellula parvula]BBO33412.1 hypothetical protein PLANPX_3024 [Lacipirellula parvula]